MKKEKKQSKASRVILSILSAVLAVILVVLLGAVVLLNHFYGKINRVEDNGPTLSQEDANRLEQEQIDEEGAGTSPTLDGNQIIWDGDPSHIIGRTDDIINILLIGQDRRPGEGRARSDSMILCTYNTKAGTLTLTSFMRDLYVQIPGYEDSRMNVAYPLGGMDLLDECLAVNFGVHVDGNVEVDFSGFEKIINALGGVDINLTSEEAYYLNNSSWQGYDTSYWDFTEGMNHMDGAQALSYSRIRYIDSDFMRTERQRNVLTALLESCRNMNVKDLWNLLNTLLPMVTTDMNDQQITSYATQILPKLAGVELVTQRIPTDDGYENASIRGMSVLVPYLETNRQFLIDTLSPAAMGD